MGVNAGLGCRSGAGSESCQCRERHFLLHPSAEDAPGYKSGNSVATSRTLMALQSS